jgi:hypothetical protein
MVIEGAGGGGALPARLSAADGPRSSQGQVRRADGGPLSLPRGTRCRAAKVALRPKARSGRFAGHPLTPDRKIFPLMCGSGLTSAAGRLTMNVLNACRLPTSSGTL